ncbi:MAG: 1-acyl-sn-glycerol-3-phosphate acyltransferase [Sandaracinaceae bacterium]|nr:1-acyl-sn-glycerol-3-phosphate acyltransferase [Sandaracinaceae bacterium]
MRAEILAHEPEPRRAPDAPAAADPAVAPEPPRAAAAPDAIAPEAIATDADEAPVPARSFEPASALDKVTSAALWAAGLGWLIPALGGLTVVYQLVPSHRIDWAGRLYCKVQIALTGSRWRAEVHPKVDPARQYVFAQNHTNHFDHVLCYNATPHFKQGLELESHFRYPFYGWFMKARGTVPVKKGQRGQTSELTERIGREIAEGRSILSFPEGSRTRTGRVRPFRTGIFFIARDLGVPVVPVAVTGAFDLMRPGSPIIRAGNELTVWVEEPIETAGATDDEIPALAERARAAVARRVDAYWAAREEQR